jgi:hypothetical protein
MKKPTKGELARRRKIRKLWYDPAHPERRKAASETQKRIWDDKTPQGKKRREDKSEEMTQFFADPAHPERREAKRKSTTRVMRSPERRKTNSETMKKLRADPKFEALRLAGKAKEKADPKKKARRVATLAKTMARPGVRKRAIRNSTKTQSLPKNRASQSAKGKERWAKLFAAEAALKEIAKTENRGRGAPPKEKRDNRAVELAGLGWLPRAIAKELEPDYDEYPDAAIGRIRKVLAKWKNSKKTGDSRDEQETLHDRRGREGGGREETHAAALD